MDPEQICRCFNTRHFVPALPDSPEASSAITIHDDVEARKIVQSILNWKVSAVDLTRWEREFQQHRCEAVLEEVTDDSNFIGNGLLPMGIERSSCGTALRFDTRAMSTDELSIRHVTVPVVILRGLKTALSDFDKLTASCVATMR